jgi:hypothetical protein
MDGLLTNLRKYRRIVGFPTTSDRQSKYPPHGIATTFTGEILGKVDFGCEYQVPVNTYPSNFMGRESTRVSISVHGINGVEYYGTYFKSSGDYARIKARKIKS